MLILIRRWNEDVCIETPAGERIVVRVTEVRGREGKVRLGFASANRAVRFSRSELIAGYESADEWVAGGKQTEAGK